MHKKLTQTESLILRYLYQYTKAKPKNLRRGLPYKLSDLIDARPDKVIKVRLTRPLSKSRLNIMFNRGPWFRIGYVEKSPKKIIAGVLISKDKRQYLRKMRKVEVLPSKNDDKNITLFKMVDSELLVIGNKDRLVKKINNNFKYRFAVEDRVLLDINPDKKLNELLDIPQKYKDIGSVEILS